MACCIYQSRSKWSKSLQIGRLRTTLGAKRARVDQSRRYACRKRAEPCQFRPNIAQIRPNLRRTRQSASSPPWRHKAWRVLLHPTDRPRWNTAQRAVSREFAHKPRSVARKAPHMAIMRVVNVLTPLRRTHTRFGTANQPPDHLAGPATQRVCRSQAPKP